MNKFKILGRLFSAVFMAVFLTSCWDKTELNERKFIVSIGIDKSDDKENGFRYKVGMSAPDPGAASDKSENKSNNESKIDESAEDKTISGAFRKSGANSSKKPYFGHTKACVISRGILEDPELLKETLDTLERNGELSKKIIALGAGGDAEDILNADISDAEDIGVFIADYYKNGKDNNGFNYSLGELIRKFHSSGDNLLPEIRVCDGDIKLDSAAVIKDYRYVGSLDERLMNGYLWVKAKGADKELSIDFLDTSVAIKLDKVKRKISFEEADGKITVIIGIDAKGTIEEFIFNDETLLDTENVEILNELCEQKISAEIMATAVVLQKDYNVDAYDFLGIMRKQNYNLYLEAADNWDEVFKNLEIVPDVNVTVRNKGGLL